MSFYYAAYAILLKVLLVIRLCVLCARIGTSDFRLTCAVYMQPSAAIRGLL